MPRIEPLVSLCWSYCFIITVYQTGFELVYPPPPTHPKTTIFGQTVKHSDAPKITYLSHINMYVRSRLKVESNEGLNSINKLSIKSSYSHSLIEQQHKYKNKHYYNPLHGSKTCAWRPGRSALRSLRTLK